MIVDQKKGLIVDYTGEYFKENIMYTSLLPTLGMARAYKRDEMGDVATVHSPSLYEIVEFDHLKTNIYTDLPIKYLDWYRNQ
jgi:hypothetical protein